MECCVSGGGANNKDKHVHEYSIPERSQFPQENQDPENILHKIRDVSHSSRLAFL
jgi:hypothetical protein